MDALEKMQHAVNSELAKNNVTVIKWNKSDCGTAYYKDREIKIPRPVDFISLGICFHEIGHIVKGHYNGNGKTRYVEEYEAEQFAIQKLEEYGFYDKQYKYNAIAYVLSKLAQARNRGHNMKNVPKEIVRWSGLQVNKWNKAQKVFVQRGTYKRRHDIVIQFYY